MKLSDECANFTLSTLNAANPASYNNADFPNVNIQNILGDMYFKYNKFALICISIGSGYTNATLNSGNALAQFKIGGLPLSNAGYNYNNATANGVFATYKIDTYGVYNSNSPINRVCFHKPSPIVNLKIIVENFTTQAINTLNNTSFCYQFVIYGLYDD